MNHAYTYAEQQILSASPQKLVLMLYSRAIIELKKSLETQNWTARAPHLRMTQDIFIQLMTGCVLETELGSNFFKLYDFYNRYLMVGQLKKDEERIHRTLEFLEGIRDTWKEAMSKAKMS